LILQAISPPKPRPRSGLMIIALTAFDCAMFASATRATIARIDAIDKIHQIRHAHFLLRCSRGEAPRKLLLIRFAPSAQSPADPGRQPRLFGQGRKGPRCSLARGETRPQCEIAGPANFDRGGSNEGPSRAMRMVSVPFHGSSFSELAANPSRPTSVFRSHPTGSTEARFFLSRL
jgi:hypothetical protein